MNAVGVSRNTMTTATTTNNNDSNKNNNKTLIKNFNPQNLKTEYSEVILYLLLTSGLIIKSPCNIIIFL